MNINELKEILNSYYICKMKKYGLKPLKVDDFNIRYYLIRDKKSYSLNLYYSITENSKLFDLDNKEIGEVYENVDDIKEDGKVIMGIFMKDDKKRKSLYGDIAYLLLCKFVNYEIQSLTYYFDYKLLKEEELIVEDFT